MSAHRPATPERSDFIREIVAADVREGRVSQVVTRFPPEPNGHLLIGHPKSIVLGETVQFERLGYFCPDPDSTPRRLVFNRTLGLRDTWARLQASGPVVRLISE